MTDNNSNGDNNNSEEATFIPKPPDPERTPQTTEAANSIDMDSILNRKDHANEKNHEG